MGKVKFNLRIKPSNKARAAVIRDAINSKQKQLDAAVQWCHENNRRGWAAVNSWLFPSIKDYRTINKRIDGIITTGNKKEYCSVFTAEEEETIVRHIRNKNRFVFCNHFDIISLKLQLKFVAIEMAAISCNCCL